AALGQDMVSTRMGCGRVLRSLSRLEWSRRGMRHRSHWRRQRNSPWMMTMSQATGRIDQHDAQPAASLYVGKVMHARLKPFAHRFQYRVMSLLIDLDQLGDADRQSHLFAVNRAGLYSFHECDHGPRDGSSLRAYADDCARTHGID